MLFLKLKYILNYKGKRPLHMKGIGGGGGGGDGVPSIENVAKIIYPFIFIPHSHFPSFCGLNERSSLVGWGVVKLGTEGHYICVNLCYVFRGRIFLFQYLPRSAICTGISYYCHTCTKYRVSNSLTIHDIYAALTPSDSRSQWPSQSPATKQA